jgi:hypothetical protein
MSRSFLELFNRIGAGSNRDNKRKTELKQERAKKQKEKKKTKEKNTRNRNRPDVKGDLFSHWFEWSCQSGHSPLLSRPS